MKPITKKYIAAGVGLTLTVVTVYFLYKYIDRKITEKNLRKAKLKEEEKKEVDPSIVKGNELPKNVGKTAYPKGDSVNVRSDASVNNGFINNFIGKVMKNMPVGKVLESTISGDGYLWYRLAVNANNLRDDSSMGKANKKSTTGYVREDNIILK